MPSLTIQNLFRFKDRLRPSLVSSVIYKYTCGQCSATYVGETRKQLRVRMSQHRGVSFRSGTPLNSLDASKIRDHSLNTGHRVHECDFRILDSCSNFDLRILESIYIHKLKPSLNDYASSVELCVLK